MAFFKSKAEREREKLMKDERKIERQIRDAQEMSQIYQQRTALDKRKDKIDEMSFKDKVRKVGTELNILERKFTTKLQSDINSVKNKQEQNLNYDRERIRMKNSYYTLITIRRAKERLVEVQTEREWSLAMRDLSKSMKLLNQISSGSQILQKAVFQYRYGRMRVKEEMADKNMDHYYGFSVDKIVKDEVMDEVQNSDLIDMLVTDDLYTRLLDNPSPTEIKECINKNVGVQMQPEEVGDIAEKDNEYAQQNQFPQLSDEEYEKLMEDMSKI